jgi:hypothetical protein
MLDTTRDFEGVAMAMDELLEEEFVRGRVAPSLSHCDEDTERRIADTLPPRTLSPGYYKLAQYCFWLRDRLTAGTVSRRCLAFEAEGIAVAERVKSEFLVRHPKCSACGALQDSRFSQSCHACHAKFTKGDD